MYSKVHWMFLVAFATLLLLVGLYGVTTEATVTGQFLSWRFLVVGAIAFPILIWKRYTFAEDGV